MIYFHKIMQILGIASIIAAVFGLLFFDFSFKAITDRTMSWSFSYYCWWLSTACFSYWGYYAIIVKKEKLLGYGVVLSYLILGVLFLKRAAFINVVVLVLFANLISNKYLIKSTGMILTLVVSIILLVFMMRVFHFDAVFSFFDLLFNRFENIEELKDIDRIREWEAYYENTSGFQFLIGNGIGHYPFLQVSENFSIEKLNALHIGLYNIIFKGGVLYSIFYIFLYLKIFKKFFRFNALSRYELVCLGVALSAFISLFYEGSWTYALEPFCISAPIFYIAQSKN